MQTFPEAVATHIEKLRELEDKLPGEHRQQLHSLRRLVELGYHDYLKQGTRIALTKELSIECQACGAAMQDSDHLYLHLRQEHDVSEEDAAEKSTEATRKHTDEVLQLGTLLAEYTEVQLEDDFS